MFYTLKKDEEKEKEKMCSQSRFPEWTEFLEKSTRILAKAASNFKFPNNCFGLWFVRAGSGNWNLSLVCVISRHSVEQVILNLKTLRIISTNKNISIAFTRVKILLWIAFWTNNFTYMKQEGNVKYPQSDNITCYNRIESDNPKKKKHTQNTIIFYQIAGS